ncbi:MAG: hypothetical protein ACYDC1_08240, partial [Limisphaerales bacterium]
TVFRCRTIPGRVPVRKRPPPDPAVSRRARRPLQPAGLRFINADAPARKLDPDPYAAKAVAAHRATSFGVGPWRYRGRLPSAALGFSFSVNQSK